MNLVVRILWIRSLFDQLMLYKPSQVSVNSSVKAASEVPTELNKIADTEYILCARISYFSLIPIHPCLIIVSISMHETIEAQIL